MEVLKYLVLIFGASALCVFILSRLRVPVVAGFFLAGLLLGPHGLALVPETEQVEVLAEVGVVLLMFTIGLEFPLRRLFMLRGALVGGGALQVALTGGAATALSMWFFGDTLAQALLKGFLVSLSSTAVVMKLLSDRGELNSPHGRTSLGILLFQDLAVVPFMLLVPVLAQAQPQGLWVSLLKALAVVAAALVLARWAVPALLHQVVSTRSRELFVITIVFIFLGTAYLTYKMGLSLALGAFLAGMIVSESEYAAQAASDVLPLKESFVGLFFISIGMMVQLQFLREHLGVVSAAVAVVFVLKSALVFVAAFLTGSPLRAAFITGLYLFQIGEFSFVLASSAREHGLLSPWAFQVFISASVLSMMLSPFVVAAAGPLSVALLPQEVRRRLGRLKAEEGYPHALKDHVIVVGYGFNGRNVARALKSMGIPYVVLELNGATVRKASREGEPIHYGDATSREMLLRMGLREARVLVVAISDAAATRRVVQVARRETPRLYIIVRTRYVLEVEDLLSLGADEVVPEEFETSIEVFCRVLDKFNVPQNLVQEHVQAVRRHGYQALRQPGLPVRRLAAEEELLRSIQTQSFLVKEGSALVGHTLKELNLKAETGATVIAIKRGRELHPNPPANFHLQAGDVLLLMGSAQELQRALEFLGTERFLVAKYQR